MRTELVVVPSPALYFVSGVLQRHEPVHIQAFVPEDAVEELDMWVARRCTWMRVIELKMLRKPSACDAFFDAYDRERLR